MLCLLRPPLKRLCGRRVRTGDAAETGCLSELQGYRSVVPLLAPPPSPSPLTNVRRQKHTSRRDQLKASGRDGGRSTPNVEMRSADSESSQEPPPAHVSHALFLAKKSLLTQ